MHFSLGKIEHQLKRDCYQLYSILFILSCLLNCQFSTRNLLENTVKKKKDFVLKDFGS